MNEQHDMIEALANAGKRVKVHNAQIVTKVPSSVKALIQEIARTKGVSDATIVRQALAEYFEKRGFGA